MGVSKCVWGEYKGGGGGSEKSKKLRTYYLHVPQGHMYCLIITWISQKSLKGRNHCLTQEQNQSICGLTSCFLQLSVDQITLQEQSHNIADLEEERNRLKEQLAELNQKIESLEGDNLTNAHQQRLELKVKELENKLDLEFTQRGRIENQVRPLRQFLS